MCGSCHKEGTPVTQTYDIPQDKILEHYSESMHGEGLFKRGLTVVAVCIDCHTAHNVLPHTDPRSSIYRDNIPQLCKRCHGQIEAVHRKVIRGELWEKEPNKVPICVDCHAPHKVRRILYEEGIADEQCLKCHDNPDLSVATRRQDHLAGGEPRRDPQLDPSQHLVRQVSHRHRPVRRRAPLLDRHAPRWIARSATPRWSRSSRTSIHGTLAARGDTNAPVCRDCHGVHNIRGHKDPKATTFAMNVPNLCGHVPPRGPAGGGPIQRQ